MIRGTKLPAMACALLLGFPVPLLLAYTGILSSEDARIIGIVFTCVLLWATASVPGYIVSLMFYFLAVLLTHVPPSAIFSGFASSAFWLVFSGGVIGFALNESGLSQRVGNLLAQRIGTSYPRALCVFALMTFALCLVMPSTFGRIAILVAIASGYCSAVGLNGNRPGRSGILLLVIVGSFELAGGVLPANLPNIIMSGILEQAFGLHLSFADYLFIFLPAGILLRGLILTGAAFLMFPDTIPGELRPREPTRMSADEWRVLLLLFVTLALWFTDSIHHVAPGWVGLGFSIAYLLTSATNQIEKFGKTQKMDLLWFIAAIIGLTALVQNIGLDLPESYVLAKYMVTPFEQYVLLTVLSSLLCLLVTSNAAPALFSPIAVKLIGDPAMLKMGMLSQVLGYSTTFFPYQAPPIIFGADAAQLERSVVLRYCLVTAALGMLIVVPVNAVWWWLIGLLS